MITSKTAVYYRLIAVHLYGGATDDAAHSATLFTVAEIEAVVKSNKYFSLCITDGEHTYDYISRKMVNPDTPFRLGDKIIHIRWMRQ